jgi:hypothetical protein
MYYNIIRKTEEYIMEKEVKVILGKKHYLLGVRKEDGLKVWLQEPSWDCDWYWGFGYIEIYSKNQKTLLEHTHFDSLFFNNKNGTSWKIIETYFKETTFNEKETWQLLDYMKTFYTLRQMSDLVHCGNSHYTTTPLVLKDDALYEKINKVMLPSLFEEIKRLLS